MTKNFPKGFIWGTATSSYQIEGAHDADGKSPSIWDTFCQQEGAIADGTNGNIACDHYNRLDEDLEIIKNLGTKNYRFSLSWPRLLPEGTGRIEQRGYDFYNRLIDGLLERNIKPWVTLYHWDLPQCLQDKGGWENPDIVKWYTEYCQTTAEKIGDRVNDWILVNEPSIATFLAYGVGFHAPGIKSEDAYLRAAHNINRSIAQGYRALKQYKPNFNVGSSFTTPLITSHNGIDAPEVEVFNGFWNTNHLDPLLLGKYPELFADKFAAANPDTIDEDLKTPLDYVGFQYYSPIYTQQAPNDEQNFFGVWFDSAKDGTEVNDLGWEISPEAFDQYFNDYKARYGTDIPVIITENGYAGYEEIQDGVVNDEKRINYLKRHIEVVRSNHLDICKGYFAWSLMDNFEWADGYTPRFGLVYVDYDDNCKRIPKESYYWYKKFLTEG